MKVFLLAFLGLAAIMMIGCGDGPNQVATPTATQRVPSPTPTQELGIMIPPCQPAEYAETTPRLPYEVEVTEDQNGLSSLSGVLIGVCTGATGDDMRATTVALGEGIQTWLETTYPEGTTVTNQAAFEEQVCAEVARLTTSIPTLAKVSWVSLATYGKFTMGVKPVTGKETPPPAPDAYSNAGCRLPKQGPTA